MKKILVLLSVLVLAAVFWLVVAVWLGIYSIYSYPPSKEHVDGSTLIIQRDQGEPAFNSPDYKPPQRPRPSGGVVNFGALIKPTRPVSGRVVLELPYVEWAYKKSLETKSEQ